MCHADIKWALKFHSYGISQYLKANPILGCTSKGTASRLRKIIIPLYLALTRWHLEHRIQSWGPQYKKKTNQKDTDKLDLVQQRTVEGHRERDVWEEAKRIECVQPEREKASGV